MSERKSIQKYYPPDYDPSKPVKRSKAKKTGPQRTSIRMMAPFSFQCNSCGGFTMKNTKFNARKEVSDEMYLGRKIFIFSLRCPTCSAEIRLRTDPKNSDYACESGAKRNFTPWRNEEVANETDEQRLERLIKEQQEQEKREERERLYGKSAAKDMEENDAIGEGEDAMQHLENKMMDAQREMEMEQELDALRTQNARIHTATKEGGLLDLVHNSLGGQLDEDRQDEEAAKSAFKRTYDGEIIRSAAPLKRPEVVDLAKVRKAPIVNGKKPRVNSLGVVKKNSLGIVKKKKSLI